MTVRLYTSSDVGAPVLTGEAGKLVDLLDACLVNGYGALAPAGWTKPYTGTASAVFRPSLGLMYFLNVNDNGPGAGTYKEARVVGYETMTAFATGTNLFPTAAQMANGAFVRKSATADATGRAWVLIGDERTFYLAVATGDTASTYLTWGYGELYSFKGVSDSGRMFLIGRSTENASTASLNTLDGYIQLGGTMQAGSYLARDTAGGVGAILFSRIGDSSAAGTFAGPLEGVVAYKNGADNMIYLAPLRVHQLVGGIQFRGRMRGLWHWCHPIAACSDRDTLTGTGDLAGKTFLILKNHPNAGILVFETSDTWDFNA